ncbi:hypothetical protein V8C42DRAFT_338650 [Trichoderma barbatum]
MKTTGSLAVIALMAKTVFADNAVMQINFYHDNLCNSYSGNLRPTGSGDSGNYWFPYNYSGGSWLIANCYKGWCCVETNNANGSKSRYCGTGTCLPMGGGGIAGINVSWG